jgi:hypothetical protein
MMLALMLHPRFKDLSILSNYVGIKKMIIALAKYDSKSLILFFCLAYQKVHPFAEHPSNSKPKK